MENVPIWFEYATFDEDMNIDGVRSDAPTEVKEAFKEFQKSMKKQTGKSKA